jgi:23S rRNA (cytidine1920-2'-O)/16S rRNA (cytidine1409-2'-O)-methyltransferase
VSGTSGPSRLDLALVSRGLARSRNAAAQAIADGRVEVAGRPASKASALVRDEDPITVTGTDVVSRAAVKLEAALDAFALDVRGVLALDLGASTGGFTQVLLRRGAAAVIALDVGHGQLVPELAADPRVLAIEGENARDLTPERLAALTGGLGAPGVVVADLSFISLRHVLPAIAAVAASDGDIVCLIKPQFEVGRTGVAEGIVRDAGARAGAVREVLRSAWEAGLGTAGLLASPLPGSHGNREVLAHLSAERGTHPAQWEDRLVRAATGDDGRHDGG